ncbi:MAG TPA: hypothetical protein VFS19_02830, partial [Planctomycetota bacterium]|nr:hypothetical protein [Planctomycetota bacterium]
RGKRRIMKLKELDGWPPTLKESYSSQKVLGPSSPALLKRCMLFSTVDGPEAYLSVVVDYQGRDWHAMITEHPAPMLRRIEATLKGHEGQTLASLGDLDVVE